MLIAISSPRAALLLVLSVLVGALFVPLGGSEPGPTYTVVRGDSLSVIARREAVSVAQLRNWNGIDGDLIEVGQALVVGPDVHRDSWTLAQWLRLRVAGESTSEEPASVAVAGKADVQQEPRHRRSPRRARQAGGAPGQEVDLQEVEESSWKPLVLPVAKDCLAVDAGLGEGAYGRSVGLDAEQVSAAVSAFQQQALRCYEGRETAEGEVVLRLVVGCDGRVRQSSVKSDSSDAAGFAGCVAAVMRYAPFPAHARDEVELLVPMHFVADTSAN